ncbi:unnamed protein product [Ilex paraguariensis]|uniref:Eukaryotic translation initiation factor 3 subunit H n=1 Tax=Ilex paraguariensis TaxID=185542 RepID=A0ABC8TT37_9AQUA
MANSTARSFLQVAVTEEVASPLRVVQIEGLVILKIIKHCKEFSPALVTGQLLGLDVGSVLEVTNCFPFPVREEDEEVEADGANYQLEMMRCLREVNVDNNTVGWYQSTLLGSYQTVELIETFMNYQLFPNLDKVVFLDDDIVIQRDLSPLWEIDLGGKVNGAVETCKGEDEWVMSKRFRNYFNFSHPLIAKNLDPDECAWAYGMNIFDLRAWRKKNIREAYHAWLKEENIKRCVCVIYDPSKSNQGVLALKALKLSDSFMELYRNNNFTGEKLREKNLSWVDIFEEIPIKVSNSALISAFMTELEADTPVTQCDYDRLQLSTNPFLEKNVEFLIECMDDLSMEQQKFQYYYRNLSRQQAQQQAWLQKRR